jgi:hypothetical protein
VLYFEHCIGVDEEEDRSGWRALWEAAEKRFGIFELL